MNDARCRLFLVTPPSADIETFAACFEQAAKAGDVASVLITPAADRGETVDLISAVMPAGYEHNVAVLVADDPELTAESGADGTQISGTLEDYRHARDMLGSDRIIGALANGSRHGIMELGDAGIDYVAFDQTRPIRIGSGDTQEDVDPIAWWSELFEIPCVAFAPAGFDDIDTLVRAGSDFIRPEDAMWSSLERAAETVKRYNARIDDLSEQ
ncbi:MAG: thiamine phosphate synthase [Hyphomicrobiales bacterium]